MVANGIHTCITIYTIHTINWTLNHYGFMVSSYILPEQQLTEPSQIYFVSKFSHICLA